MKAMELGDLAFYHSNEGKDIVGVCEVVSGYYPDHTDPKERFGMVDFKAICDMLEPVSLAEIKATKSLSEMALLKQMRLSVGPVRKKNGISFVRWAVSKQKFLKKKLKPRKKPQTTSAENKCP